MSRSPRRPRRLTHLRVDEVSVVTKPANGKRFLILKNESQGGTAKATPAAVARIVSETLAAALAPVSERLTAVEIAHQVRAGTVQRPGRVRKADGTVSWEGTHILN